MATKETGKNNAFKLGRPIDRVPRGKSRVFCIGMAFPFYQQLTVFLALPVAMIVFLKRCSRKQSSREESVVRLLGPVVRRPISANPEEYFLKE